MIKLFVMVSTLCIINMYTAWQCLPHVKGKGVLGGWSLGGARYHIKGLGPTLFPHQREISTEGIIYAGGGEHCIASCGGRGSIPSSPSPSICHAQYSCRQSLKEGEGDPGSRLVVRYTCSLKHIKFSCLSHSPLLPSSSNIFLVDLRHETTAGHCTRSSSPCCF